VYNSLCIIIMVEVQFVSYDKDDKDDKDKPNRYIYLSYLLN